jgi:hypothetical protein
MTERDPVDEIEYEDTGIHDHRVEKPQSAPATISAEDMKDLFGVELDRPPAALPKKERLAKPPGPPIPAPPPLPRSDLAKRMDVLEAEVKCIPNHAPAIGQIRKRLVALEESQGPRDAGLKRKLENLREEASEIQGTSQRLQSYVKGLERRIETAAKVQRVFENRPDSRSKWIAFLLGILLTLGFGSILLGLGGYFLWMHLRG